MDDDWSQNPMTKQKPPFYRCVANMDGCFNGKSICKHEKNGWNDGETSMWEMLEKIGFTAFCGLSRKRFGKYRRNLDFVVEEWCKMEETKLSVRKMCRTYAMICCIFACWQGPENAYQTRMCFAGNFLDSYISMPQWLRGSVNALARAMWVEPWRVHWTIALWSYASMT